MDCLRRFRIWSGKVSYCAIERKGGHRFAASTFCTVLKGNELPSFDMVQVIVTVCDGSEQQQDLFGHAWRRLKLQQDADQPAKQPVKKPVKKPQSRPLRAVSETASRPRAESAHKCLTVYFNLSDWPSPPAP